MEAVAGLGVEAEIVHVAVADADPPDGAASLPTEACLCAGLLARFMSDLSEDYWAAGWLTGLEFQLWGAVQEEASRVGQANPTRHRLCSCSYPKRSQTRPAIRSRVLPGTLKM